MRHFRPNLKHTLKSYYEVPPDVLEETTTLLTWTGRAIEDARKAPLRRPAGVRTSS